MLSQQPLLSSTLQPSHLHFSSLLAYALEFTGLKESASSLMIPVYLFIISTVFLLLYGIFQLMTGSLSYQATSPIGHAKTESVYRSHSKSLTSGSASL